MTSGKAIALLNSLKVKISEHTEYAINSNKGICETIALILTSYDERGKQRDDTFNLISSIRVNDKKLLVWFIETAPAFEEKIQRAILILEASLIIDKASVFDFVAPDIRRELFITFELKRATYTGDFYIILNALCKKYHVFENNPAFSFQENIKTLTDFSALLLEAYNSKNTGAWESSFSYWQNPSYISALMHGWVSDDAIATTILPKNLKIAFVTAAIKKNQREIARSAFTASLCFTGNTQEMIDCLSAIFSYHFYKIEDELEKFSIDGKTFAQWSIDNFISPIYAIESLIHYNNPYTFDLLLTSKVGEIPALEYFINQAGDNDSSVKNIRQVADSRSFEHEKKMKFFQDVILKLKIDLSYVFENMGSCSRNDARLQGYFKKVKSLFKEHADVQNLVEDKKNNKHPLPKNEKKDKKPYKKFKTDIDFDPALALEHETNPAAQAMFRAVLVTNKAKVKGALALVAFEKQHNPQLLQKYLARVTDEQRSEIILGILEINCLDLLKFLKTCKVHDTDPIEWFLKPTQEITIEKKLSLFINSFALRNLPQSETATYLAPILAKMNPERFYLVISEHKKQLDKHSVKNLDKACEKLAVSKPLIQGSAAFIFLAPPSDIPDTNGLGDQLEPLFDLS